MRFDRFAGVMTVSVGDSYESPRTAVPSADLRTSRTAILRPALDDVGVLRFATGSGAQDN